jgi:hypothetical protein
MSDSEIKEFGLARLKEDINIDEDGRFVDHLEEGSIVLVTKLPSDAAMLAYIDLGSIKRFRTIKVPLEN